MKTPILILLLGACSAIAHSHPREMILAGGAMKICTSLNTSACNKPSKEFAKARTKPRYEIKENDIAILLNTGFWSARKDTPTTKDLQAMLSLAKQKARGNIFSARQLEDILSAICVDNAKVINCTRNEASNIWDRLLDEERSFVLSALEIPEFANGQRLREIAKLNDSKNTHGAAILKVFVEAAAKRSPGKKPRIIFVTASSADPYDAVDFYMSALQQAGADPVWWPIDLALSAAIYGGRDCQELSQLRIEKLALANREHVFPDLTSLQKLACENPEALAQFPSQAQGIFFSGGDQWRLRQAMFDDNDQPNLWLENLRLAFDRGEIVVGGTSAGSAVQSGIAMLSNGSSKNAINRGAKISRPMDAGCERAKRCSVGMQEDDLTYWPAGGLALVDSLVFDTHFSERARELRLLRLLHDANAKTGIGIDETSAVHLTWLPESTEVEALGASGAWWFDISNQQSDKNKMSARVHYLAPGRNFIWKNNNLSSLAVTEKREAKAAIEKTVIEDALQDGALRAVAQQMATNTVQHTTLKAQTAKVTLVTTPETSAWVGPQGQIGVTHLILELSR